MQTARLTYAAIVAGAALWCALILLDPAALLFPRLAPLRAVLYAFFSPLCHQIDSRSIHLLGAPLAVCGRCSSIYFAFLLGTIAYPFAGSILRSIRPGAVVLLVAG